MPFESQPTLTGESMQLRPLREDDYAALFEVASDPLIWEQHPDQSTYSEPGFRIFSDATLESGNALIAIDRETGAVIGSSRYHGYNARSVGGCRCMWQRRGEW